MESANYMAMYTNFICNMGMALLTGNYVTIYI